MIDYKKLYHIMVDGVERAISAISQQNYGIAKKLLIRAEREAEEVYLCTAGNGEAEEGEAPRSFPSGE